MTRPLILLIVTGAVAAGVRAQEPTAADPGVSIAAPLERAATLTYANRPIVELRAEVLSRMPAERVAAAQRALDDLVARGVTSPVSMRAVSGTALIAVGGEGVFAIVPADVDALAGDTVEGTAATVVSRLQVALAEANELRAPGRLLRAAIETLAISVVLAAVLWLLGRLQSATTRRLTGVAERRLAGSWTGRTVGAYVPRVLQRGISLVLGAGGLVLVYLWAAFVLRRFPYTRPWGESLRALLFAQIASLGRAIVDALPGLFTVTLIFVAVWWASRGIGLLFDAVSRGRVSMPGVYPDTAVPMRRLAVALLWLAALAMAYPYVPGSGSAGFKGISLFVGVIISFGSTGVVQHLMSGLMLTFARAIHVGDFARIGDAEGTILQVGALATKLRTPLGEEVTIPNAVVLSQTMTNYSTGAGNSAALLPTSVTIGYDTPWRQVEALLLTAARSTPGVRAAPSPVVWRVSLEDYYVKYTLLVAPEDPGRRAEVLDRLHARVLDVFNEHGVQIMSPHYVGDPSSPKVVPPSRWHAPPAPAVVRRPGSA